MVALRTLLFTIFVPGTVTVLVPYLLLSSRHELSVLTLSGYSLVGLVPIILGACIYGWCAWDFTFGGRGTPAPLDPPKVLVVSGLYRFTRNPIYVGVWLVLIGEAILFQSATLFIYALLVLLGFHLFILFYEEPTLRAKFGAAYVDYCNTVPRWIPNLRRWMQQ